jgi:hypothetical protein
VAAWTTVAHHAARLVRAVRAVPRGSGGDGGAADRLARLVEQLGEADPGVPRAAARAVGDLVALRADDPVVRELRSLHEAVTALADARGFLLDDVPVPGAVSGRVLGPDLAAAPATVTLVDRDGGGAVPVTVGPDGRFSTTTAPGAQLVVVPGRGVDAGPTAVRPRDDEAVLPDVVLPRRAVAPAPVRRDLARVPA